MDNKYSTDYINAISKQLLHIRNTGYPGLVQNMNKMPNASTFEDWNRHVKAFMQSFPVSSGCDNELMLLLPYAGINISVKLLFNLHQPWVSPDILVSDNEFMASVTSEHLQNTVPCLNKWQFMSEGILSTFIVQILDLYKQHQMEMLGNHELLCFEYKSLLSSLDIQPEDIEVCVASDNPWLATFLIKLPLDLSSLPPVLCDSNPGNASAFLHIIIRKAEGLMVPRLHLSPQLEYWINAESVSLPVVPSGSSITDYTLDIHKRLKLKIKSIAMRFESRKQLMAQLLCNYGTCLLEYDCETFNNAVFLFEANDFDFIASITINDDFNKPSISVSLRSVYHVISMESSKPYVDTLELVNLSSTPQETVDAITKVIRKNLSFFQTSSMETK